ncbi:MAG: GyrI-like domain-containing protein [Candidatus Promineofilum sp.]|nr:GyrI-like domain-containing protein [Promineifilum sp.]
MLQERFSDVTITDLPPLRVACFRAISRTPEDDALRVLTRWAVGAGFNELPRSFGFDVEVSPRQADAGLRGYEVWLVVPEGVEESKPVTIHDFAGGRYATLTIHHPFDDPFAIIPAGWHALHEWVTARRLAPLGEPPYLEEVVAGEGGQDMILYHPVRPV